MNKEQRAQVSNVPVQREAASHIAERRVPSSRSFQPARWSYFYCTIMH